MYGEVLRHHLITTMNITTMEEETIVDMMMTEDHMVVMEEMIMGLLLLLPTHLIDIIKTNNVATTAITMDGMTMRGDITKITMIEAVAVGDDEDHLLPQDYPNRNFHRHYLAPIAN